MSGNINVSKCVQYLRYMEIDVTPEAAEAWVTQEKAVRERRRAHRRELKKSCGHFRTSVTTIVSERGTEHVRFCRECRRAVDPRRRYAALVSPPQEDET